MFAHLRVQPLTKCKGFKLVASDGKRRLTDCLPQKEILALIEVIPGKNAVSFIKWFTYSEDTIPVFTIEPSEHR